MKQALFNRLQNNFKTFIGQSKLPPIEPPKIFGFDQSHIGRKLSDIAKDTQIKSLIDSGLPEDVIKKSMRGKRWGWEVTVKKIFDCEKTFIFGYGNDEVGYKISFSDTMGHEFVCLVNTSFDLDVGNECAIDGTISEIDPTKKQIRLNRVKVLKNSK